MKKLCFMVGAYLILALNVTVSFGDSPIYISDMSKCQPADALSTNMTRGKWQLISYESAEVSGTMVAAHSFIDAPDLTIPLNVSGWYAVYLGYWNFDFAADGETIIKARLNDAPAFRQVCEPTSSDTQDATYLREVFFGNADLTGKSLVVGKTHGIICRKMCFAYVKLVPLTTDEIEKVKTDRADRSKRNLVATIDGSSFWHFSEYRTPAQILEQVELYRNSDVAKVLWAVCYGGTTNYKSNVKGAAWAAGDDGDSRVMRAEPGNLSNDYVRGERQMVQSMRELDAKGLIPQEIAAKEVHSMGIKFDIMFRLGMAGGLPPRAWLSSAKSFTNQHPEYNQVMQDGSIVGKSSYAYPEVRKFMLDIIEEASGKIDADGINLCFVRGPHFLQYEKPILEAYTTKTGKNAREAKSDDPNLLKIRASFMTEFVRDARKILDKVGKSKGKHLELSVWVWPNNRNVWLGGTPAEEGLDVNDWIKEGLLDSVICQQGVDAEYLRLCKEHNCRFILHTGYSGQEAMSPASVTHGYKSGANAFAFWDIDAAQISPDSWEWIRRIGHRDEMAAWDAKCHGTKSIQLDHIDGRNLKGSLAQEVYSGG